MSKKQKRILFDNAYLWVRHYPQAQKYREAVLNAAGERAYLLFASADTAEGFAGFLLASIDVRYDKRTTTPIYAKVSIMDISREESLCKTFATVAQAHAELGRLRALAPISYRHLREQQGYDYQ